MGKIVCRRCPDPACGVYNDLSIDTCGCGADLRRVHAVVVETPILPEMLGDIDEKLPVYVQKCSYCGAENYTLDPARPVRLCWNCHRQRVASVKPSLFVVEEPKPEPESPIQIPGQDPARDIHARKPEPMMYDDDDDDDDDDDYMDWVNIVPGGKDNIVPEKKKEKQAEPQTGRTLTLTALRYGTLSFSLTAGVDTLPYLLGRSANQAQFLGQDLRVGNQHCELLFRGGSWYVHEIQARNGTAVNWDFLDIGGEAVLHNGDELILGHHADSMAFRVTIR